MPTSDRIPVRAELLRALCIRVLERLDVSPEDAALTADVLVACDLRGIDSHGVAHLRRYVDDMRRGVIVARPSVRTIVDTQATATVDAGAGLGQPVSVRAMRRAIDKALDVGAGFVAGEKELEMSERRAREGIPLHPEVAADLRQIADEVAIVYDLEG
jgi:L-2-hydroxycarboxylate dehydrogenase (NAD+)